MKEFNENTQINISLECVEDILELLKEQETVEYEEKETSDKRMRYPEKEMDELVEKMVQFLETHMAFELMELVTAAVATKEQE